MSDEILSMLRERDKCKTCYRLWDNSECLACCIKRLFVERNFDNGPT